MENVQIEALEPRRSKVGKINEKRGYMMPQGDCMNVIKIEDTVTVACRNEISVLVKFKKK